MKTLRSLPASAVASKFLCKSTKFTASSYGKPSSTSYAKSSSTHQLGSSGRGNNWAFAYQRTDIEPVTEAVRRHVESVDDFRGFLLFHSLSGIFRRQNVVSYYARWHGVIGRNLSLIHARSSGLTSRLVETLRDEYPLDPMVTASVLPFMGELPLQQYNNVMCLSWLQW